MLIEYVATRSRRNVSEVVGTALITRGIARAVDSAYGTVPTEGTYKRNDMRPEKVTDSSPARSEKPKRQYKRRDMRPEE